MTGGTQFKTFLFDYSVKINLSIILQFGDFAMGLSIGQNLNETVVKVEYFCYIRVKVDLRTVSLDRHSPRTLEQG